MDRRKMLKTVVAVAACGMGVAPRAVTTSRPMAIVGWFYSETGNGNFEWHELKPCSDGKWRTFTTAVSKDADRIVSIA